MARIKFQVGVIERRSAMQGAAATGTKAVRVLEPIGNVLLASASAIAGYESPTPGSATQILTRSLGTEALP